MYIAPFGETPHNVQYKYNYDKMLLESVADNKISPDEETCEFSYDNFGRLQSTLYANDAE